jgi:hypothetical protein
MSQRVFLLLPSTEVPGEPQELHSLTKQSHRLKRIASASVGVVVGALFLRMYLTTALLPAVAVAVISVVVVRTPLFRSSGTVRLQTDDNPEAVLRRFTDPPPPILAFQWNVAGRGTIEGTDDGSIIDVAYTFDRRFGLRRVPQQTLGEQYRDTVLDAQGFTIVGREIHVGISHICQISLYRLV